MQVLYVEITYGYPSIHNILRNKINYVIIRSRFKNSITSTKTYPGVDTGSDHNSVVAVVNIKLKNLKQKNKRRILDVKQLKKPKCLTQYKKESIKYSKTSTRKIRALTK